MTYELAKELKDAGFPQDIEAGDWIFDHENNRVTSLRVVHPDHMEMLWTKIPTLTELIEACGKQFDTLYFRPTGSNMHDGKGAWFARKAYPIMTNPRVIKMPDRRGSTPDEAVARLWLALNK